MSSGLCHIWTGRRVYSTTEQVMKIWYIIKSSISDVRIIIVGLHNTLPGLYDYIMYSETVGCYLSSLCKDHEATLLL